MICCFQEKKRKVVFFNPIQVNHFQPSFCPSFLVVRIKGIHHHAQILNLDFVQPAENLGRIKFLCHDLRSLKHKVSVFSVPLMFTRLMFNINLLGIFFRILKWLVTKFLLMSLGHILSVEKELLYSIPCALNKVHYIVSFIFFITFLNADGSLALPSTGCPDFSVV